MNRLEQLELIVKTIDDKKGENINIIDMRNVASLASYYVICSVNSERQASAIAHTIEKELIQNNLPYNHTEGKRGDSKWILVDAEEVLIHIFETNEREVYNLDLLWGDQPKLNLKDYI